MYQRRGCLQWYLFDPWHGAFHLGTIWCFEAGPVFIFQLLSFEQKLFKKLNYMKITNIETSVIQTSVLDYLFATQRTIKLAGTRSSTTFKPTARMTSGCVSMMGAYLSPSPARITEPHLGEIDVQTLIAVKI